MHYIFGLEKKIVSCNGLNKNRVGRSELIFFDDFFVQKYVFNECFLMIWSREG